MCAEAPQKSRSAIAGVTAVLLERWERWERLGKAVMWLAPPPCSTFVIELLAL